MLLPLTRRFTTMMTAAASSSSSGPGLLTILSPAKSLDFSGCGDLVAAGTPATAPAHLDAADAVAAAMQTHSKASLGSVLGISANLAALNHERYANFEPSSVSSAVTEPADERYKQSMYAFDGDAYKGLDASSLSEPAVSYAQANLRILCGLYGQLRPLDLIQPYRSVGGRASSPFAALQ